MSLKILMLNPPFMPRFSRQSRSPCVAKGGTFYYPYYLAYATGALEKAGFKNIKLVDSIANGWTHQQTFDFVKEFNPDLVVQESTSVSIYNDLHVADTIKKMLPHIHVNVVGVHVTKNTDDSFLASQRMDSVSRGEFDYTSVDLAKAVEAGKNFGSVDGLSWREKDGKVHHNKPRDMIQNLDELPFVSDVYLRHFGEEGIKKYFYASIRWPEVTVLTARGCPFNCSFCNIQNKSSYRARSPENVVEEWEFIEKNMPFVEEIQVEDDTFPVDKKRTLEICRLLKEKNIRVPWSINARVNTDFDTLKAMKEANCRLLCVGFESPTKQVLDNIHKVTTEDLQVKFMENTRKAGLLVQGCFIVGLPGDTKESSKATIDFAKVLNCDTAQFYSLYAYPGTEAWAWAKANNYLTTEDPTFLVDELGQHRGNVDVPGFSHDEAVQMCHEALKDYYLRWGYIWPKFKQSVTSLEEAKRTFIAAKTFFAYLMTGKPKPVDPNAWDVKQIQQN